jgi:hypothetical protein
VVISIRHPEVPAQRASKDAAIQPEAVALRGSPRERGSHLRVTVIGRRLER